MSKFDIDKFPESEAAKRMLSRISPIYDNSYVGKWLYEVMGREWDAARGILLSMRDQIFTSTVTWGIEFQEDKYSLDHDTTLTLEERRARLYRRRCDHAPLNPRYIETYLYQSWGITVDVDETYANGVILLTVPFLRQSDEDTLKKMFQDLRRIKPSHLSVKVIHQIDGYISNYTGGTVANYNRVALTPELSVPSVSAKTSTAVGGIVQWTRNISVQPQNRVPAITAVLDACAGVVVCCARSISIIIQ